MSVEVQVTVSPVATSTAPTGEPSSQVAEAGRGEDPAEASTT